MKKSQRLRLAALKQKDSSARSADENAELQRLDALAVAHPDATKDEDDSATTATVAAVAATAATPSLSAAIKGVIASFRGNAALGTDLATAQQQIVSLTAERDQARTEVTAASAVTAELTQQLATISAFFGVTPADLKGKDAAGVTALLQQKISDAATEHVAGLGFPAGQLPKPDVTGGKGSAAELRARYHELLGSNSKAAAEFYAANAAKMLT